MTGLSYTTVQIFYLLFASVLTAGADALVVHLLGRMPWGKSVKIGLLALVPFFVVIAGFFLLLATPFYKSQIAWTMTFGLPLLVFFAFLWLAWIVKIIFLCQQSGTKAGLIAGLIVFPMLWSGILTGKGLLWNVLDNLREPTTLEDGVERGNTAYLKRELTPENRNEIFFYALRHANDDAVKLALDAGASPNEPVGLSSSSPRTPLLWVIDSSAAPGKRLKTLKLLLDRGADPNKPSPQQVYYSSSPAVGKTETPLEVARANKASELEKALVAAGAR
jgi:hypothetical protein